MALPCVGLGRDFLIPITAWWKVTLFCLIRVSEAMSVPGFEIRSCCIDGGQVICQRYATHSFLWQNAVQIA